MHRRGCSLVGILLLLAAEQSGAQSKPDIRPAMVIQAIGPGVDLSVAPRAESTSVAIIYYVLSGTEQPTAQLAARLEKSHVNHQRDGCGNVWSFEPMDLGRGWRREVHAQRGPGCPAVDAKATAGLRLTSYLNYKATNQAFLLRQSAWNAINSAP